MMIMKNIIVKIILLVGIFGNSSLIFATESPNKEIVPKKDPVQFLHTITDQILSELKRKQNKPEQIDKVVNNLILPNVDFDEMCKWIVGRSGWSKALEEDRNEFINELKILLTKTYSSTLSNYSEETIEFQNYNGDLNSKRVQIKSTVVRQDKDNIFVDYRLIAVDDSWKVYDVIIEGVSILQGFKTQFSEDIKLYGLKAVSAKIKNHNRKDNAKL